MRSETARMSDALLGPFPPSSGKMGSVDVVLVAIGVFWIGWITGVIPAFRVHRARLRVRAWAAQQDFDLIDCHYSFWNAHWRVPFKITVRDRSGRELNGVAAVPGFFRRAVDVDWGGSGRGQR